MKIQCNVCRAAEATVLCCADEATLCWGCDRKVHSANKLAGKHQRVPLSSSSSHMPNCDICQETVGYFFCLEDRALLCRKCDVAIHTANNLVSTHKRFLLTGVKVGLEATEPGPSSSSEKKHDTEQILKPEPRSLPKKITPVLTNSQHLKNVPVHGSVGGGSSSSKLPSAGGSSVGAISLWQVDEFIRRGEIPQNYGFVDDGSSKADNGKHGASACAPVPLVADGKLTSDERLDQMPDTFWAVPEISSLPTTSGFWWPENYQNLSKSVDFVPDVGSSPMQNFRQHHHQSHTTSAKRRRHF